MLDCFEKPVPFAILVEFNVYADISTVSLSLSCVLFEYRIVLMETSMLNQEEGFIFTFSLSSLPKFSVRIGRKPIVLNQIFPNL